MAGDLGFDFETWETTALKVQRSVTGLGLSHRVARLDFRDQICSELRILSSRRNPSCENHSNRICARSTYNTNRAFSFRWFTFSKYGVAGLKEHSLCNIYGTLSCWAGSRWRFW